MYGTLCHEIKALLRKRLKLDYFVNFCTNSAIFMIIEPVLFNILEYFLGINGHVGQIDGKVEVDCVVYGRQSGSLVGMVQTLVVLSAARTQHEWGRVSGCLRPSKAISPVTCAKISQLQTRVRHPSRVRF
jgi:hypothetical protein